MITEGAITVPSGVLILQSGSCDPRWAYHATWLHSKPCEITSYLLMPQRAVSRGRRVGGGLSRLQNCYVARRFHSNLASTVQPIVSLITETTGTLITVFNTIHTKQIFLVNSKYQSLQSSTLIPISTT